MVSMRIRVAAIVALGLVLAGASCSSNQPDTQSGSDASTFTWVPSVAIAQANCDQAAFDSYVQNPFVPPDCAYQAFASGMIGASGTDNEQQLCSDIQHMAGIRPGYVYNSDPISSIDMRFVSSSVDVAYDKQADSAMVDHAASLHDDLIAAEPLSKEHEVNQDFENLKADCLRGAVLTGQ
jgi:hypothetical protein